MTNPSPASATPSRTLRLIPLGGLGEVGLNSTLFECGQDRILVDAGLMFPEREMPGVDLVIPDFSVLRDGRGTLHAVLLTHGHEDHVGALPFLLREMPLPVYGTPLTLALVSEKLKEFHLEDRAELIPLVPRQALRFGCFTVEPIRVTHSIVDGVAFGITTPAGRIVHTGDFKIDESPVDDRPIDVERFVQYGDEGTLVLLSDSTNAEREGATASERVVGNTFMSLFPEAEGKIIVATFSSNIHRIQQVCAAAEKAGRKVFLSGRSIVQNARLATELGYLRIPEEILRPFDELSNTPDREIVLITTGSQGETNSALTRMAGGEHKDIQIRPGDMVILSSRIIPGNERPISRIMNSLLKRGARVVHEKSDRVHVSGHAAREDQAKMLGWVRPRFFIPVHGEYRQLAAHAEVARKMQVPPEHIVLCEDGDIVEVSQDKIAKVGRAPAGRVFIDGKGSGNVDLDVLRDRLWIGEDGFLVVLLHPDGRPEIVSRGFVLGEATQTLLPALEQVARRTLESLASEGVTDDDAVKIRVRNVLKKEISKTMDRRPMILPVRVQR